MDRYEIRGNAAKTNCEMSLMEKEVKHVRQPWNLLVGEVTTEITKSRALERELRFRCVIRGKSQIGNGPGR